MNFETILAGIPDYAKDIKLNLSSLLLAKIAAVIHSLACIQTIEISK